MTIVLQAKRIAAKHTSIFAKSDFQIQLFGMMNELGILRKIPRGYLEERAVYGIVCS